MTRLSADYGDELENISGNMWNFWIEKSEMEANDKIKTVPKGQRVVANGVVYRWFTDVSGLGLADELGHGCTLTRRREKKSWLSTWRCGRTR